MRTHLTVWIVAYDIRDDARLRKVHKTVRGYGDPLQYSVYRCVISGLQLAQLKDKLTRVIDAHDDQVLFVPLGSADAERTWQHWTLGQPIAPSERVVRIF